MQVKPESVTSSPMILDTSIIELSREALERNLGYIRGRVGDGVRISSVIKANAYGHGIGTFLPMAEDCGIRHFSVFSTDEAEKAIQARTRPDTEIMVLGAVPDGAVEWLTDQEISFYLFEIGRMEEAKAAAARLGKPAKVHLQIETGMHRTGFEPHEFSHVISYLQEHERHIRVEGLCTHFAGAESIANHVRIQKQKGRFKDAIDHFQQHLGPVPHIHAASSAALFAYPETIYNMVRIGIAQYGLWPSREIYMLVKREENERSRDPLQRLIRWHSRIMSVKEVGEGEFVGYGTQHMTNRRERIATVPVGYSHGFGRNLTNAGYVLVRGERARVAGPVNMNMLTIDITDIEGVEKGDEVVIIGEQGDQEITLASFGELRNDLNYEVLTRLPERIPRRVV